jgi:hypothetical protein
MPNRLRQINNEYGAFCGAASEVARNWFSGQDEVTATALLAEGQRVGVYDTEPFIEIPLSQRPSYNSYNWANMVDITIDENCVIRGVIPMVSWDYDLPAGRCEIGYADGTRITAHRPRELPPGIRYLSGAHAMTAPEVNSCRSLVRRQGHIDWVLPSTNTWAWRPYDDPVPENRIVRMSLREYELPRNGNFTYSTLTILH